MKRLLALCLTSGLLSLPVHANKLVGTGTIHDNDTAPTGCVVNFLDPITVTFPYCRDLATVLGYTVQDDASVANKYYVNYTSGTGSTCSQASPCANITNVVGKAGTNGGPAIIYVKGNGYLSLITGTLKGSSGNPVQIKPWPGDSTPTVWTATNSTCQRPGANYVDATGINYLIFDGGPDMLIRFKGSGCTQDQNGYTLVVSSNDITLYRVRIDGNDSGGPALGPGVGSGSHTSNFLFLNSEIHNSNRYYGIYSGGGTGCAAGDTTHTNMRIIGNVFRQIDGRGIQIEPRADSDGLIVEGNLGHDIGYNVSGAPGISMFVQPAASCGGSTAHVKIWNNIGFDLGGGMVRVDYDNGSGDPWLIYNNTTWDYANATPVVLNSHGVTGFSTSSCTTACEHADIRSNIIIARANSGVEPINSERDDGFTTNDNLCESGVGNCGTGSITGTVLNSLVSTSTSSSSFLFPAGPALSACLIQSGFEVDYLGVSRGTAGQATDCGAINIP